jgi:hypothetical protein
MMQGNPNPKVNIKRRMSEQSDTGFNDMPMFALSNSVLL